MKSKTAAYLLWFFLGMFSAHRFYLGKIGTGILYLLTGQLLGIGWIIDLFLIGGMVDRYNLEQKLLENMAAPKVVVNVNSPSEPAPDITEIKTSE